MHTTNETPTEMGQVDKNTRFQVNKVATFDIDDNPTELRDTEVDEDDNFETDQLLSVGQRPRVNSDAASDTKYGKSFRYSFFLQNPFIVHFGEVLNSYSGLEVIEEIFQNLII